MKDSPLSLYFHTPFCSSKCHYCHFYTLVNKQAKFDLYFIYLNKELKKLHTKIQDQKINSIFFGGGTPSLVSAHNIAKILQTTKRLFNLAPDIEISLEANPESVTEEKLQIYKENGVNRLSLGMQAGQDRLLRYLGRVHNLEKITRAVQLVKQAGFTNFNLDLIFGIPTQTLAEWQESLTIATQLNPNHMACYSLELDNESFWGKQFAQGNFQPADEDLDREMYHWGKNYLAEKGFEQYEISNFARDNKKCLHNSLFWKGHEYIGLGAGASSFYDATYWQNLDSIDGYIEAMKNETSIIKFEDLLSPRENALEAFLVMTRLIEGVNLKEFKDRFGLDIETTFAKILTELQEEKMITIKNNVFQLTEKGTDLENSVLARFDFCV